MPAPGYASIVDLKDELINMDFGTNSNLTTAVLMRFKSKINGEINAALESGGYEAPDPPDTTTLSEDVEAASSDTSVIGVTTGDGVTFSTALTNGNTTIRIYGLSTADFNDEFTEMVAVATDDITVQALENGYDAGGTIESILEGYKQLRNIEAKGAAARTLNAPDIRSGNRNAKVDEMMKWYRECIDQLQKGEMKLDGFSQRSGAMTSWQNENSSDVDVLVNPVWNTTDPF